MHWRQQWDYSGGILTDWGMHQLDTVQLALGMEKSGPVKITGKGTINEGSMYNAFVDYEVWYTYANGIQVHVKSGGTALGFQGSKWYVGNKGWAQAMEASSEELLKWEPGDQDIKLPTNPGAEHRSFLDAVHERKDPYFPAEEGHRCATLCHIGNIAMLLNRTLQWDPKQERFINDDEANKNMMYTRELRKPWTLT
jgi:predicted dehydrogenase